MKNKNTIIISFFKKIHSINRNFRSYLRLQLLALTGFCIITSLIVVFFTISILQFNDFGKVTYIDYSDSINYMDKLSANLSNELMSKDLSLDSMIKIEKIVNKYHMNYNLNIVLTNLDGHVLLSVGEKTPNKIDINKLITKILRSRMDTPYNDSKIFYTFYPISFKEKKAYLIINSIPKPEAVYKYSDNILLSSIFMGTISFIAMFLILTKKTVSYIEIITNGLIEISKGNLDYKVPVHGSNELSLLAENINHMEFELKTMIEKEREAEITKNELITNVSHDLRTPLTSIIGYLNLVKDGRYENEWELKNYCTIAFNRATKLKSLIDDLFEYTKLSNKGMKLYKNKLSLNGMLNQLVNEMIVVSNENKVELDIQIPDFPVMAFADGDKLARVFENLLSNAIKYSSKPSIISIKLRDHDTSALISIKNKSDSIRPDKLNKIFDRFYRIEKSRNSSKGGSGLGLSICKNIIELHEGKIWAYYEKQYITFYIELPKGKDF